MRVIKSNILSVSALVVALASHGAVHAQAGGQPAAMEAVSDSADIIVTAQRRSENAQSVPVSIVALGAVALEEKQVRSLADLTTVAPGIRFVSQGGGGSMNIIMRGLGKAPVGDAPNAVISYFGDVPLYFWGSDVPTYDLENVQVLKGPQGTLFGRNAIGGAVLIVPSKPTYDLEGYGRVSLGNYDYRDFEGAVNVPVIDGKVALRVAGKLSRRDGYYKNLTSPKNRASDIHRDSIRASLLIEPTENLRNTTIVDKLDGDEVGEGSTLVAVFPNGVVRNPALASVFDCHTVTAFNPVACVGFQPTRDIDDALTQSLANGRRNMSTLRDMYLRRKLWGIQNKTELELGNVEIRNIFGYRRTNIRVLAASAAVAFNPPLLEFSGAITIDQWTEEVQLLGKLFDDRLDWIVGGFYVHEDPNGLNWSKNNIGSTASAYANSFNNRKSKALYGQIGFQIVDGLKLNAGYRHTWDTAKVCLANTPAAAGVPTLTGDTCRDLAISVTVPYKQDKPTYTVGLDWKVNDNVFAYVTHRRSFRTGGVNAPNFNTPATAFLRPFQTYAPEKVTDVEAGVKTDWMIGDMKARFNVDVFRMDYSGVHTSVNVAALVPGGDQAFPYNSGSVVAQTGKRRFTGGEAEFMLKPLPSLTLSGNAAYVHQKIISFALPAGLLAEFTSQGKLFALPVAAQLSPKWSFSLSGRWELPIKPLDGDVVLNADFYRQTGFQVGNANLPAYDVTNARLEWNNINQTGASLAVFARNLFNQTNAVAAGATSASLGFFSFQYSEPRMYGIEATFRFGK